MTPPAIRAGRDDDAAGFIALISACWAEYPGCVFDLDGEVPELKALASHMAAKGGALWTAEDAGRVAGVISAAPSLSAAGVWEIGKMYVSPQCRGTGLAGALLSAAEKHVRARGIENIDLWSDTRFDRAHRFYEKRSFVRAGAIRALGDKSNSIEFHYAKPFDGIEALDAAGAGSAERRLAEILKACVDGGAAVTFLPPLAIETARDYWRRVSREVAAGSCRLLAAWSGGELVGTVQLDLGTPPNQQHRAELRKLLVAPEARRLGLAKALMLRAETEARAGGRTLLTLDTRAGDAADALYRSLRWTDAGCIPGYARNGDGTLHDAVFFWKRIDGAPRSIAAAIDPPEIDATIATDEPHGTSPSA